LATFFKRHRCKRFAIIERIIADARQLATLSKCHAFQSHWSIIISGERISTDACYARWDRDRCEPGAAAERSIADAYYTCGNFDTCQSRAAGERILADARHRLWDYQIGNKRIVQIQVFCITQRIGIIITKRNVTPRRKVGNMDTRQRGATGERIFADGGHRIGDCDRLKRRAILKRTVKNIAACDCDRFQRCGNIVRCIKRSIVLLCSNAAITVISENVTKQGRNRWRGSACTAAYKGKRDAFQRGTA